MSSQTNINNGDIVVADIINEIHSNSAQPHTQHTQQVQNPQMQHPQMQNPQMQPQPQQQRGTPMPQQMQKPLQQQRGTPMPQQMQKPLQQQRGTPMPQQMQHPPQQQRAPINRGTPIQTGKNTDNGNFMKRQKERMQKKKKQVRFNEIVEEFGDEDDDETDSTEVVMNRPPKDKVKTAPKFLTSDDVDSSDLKETKGLYSSVMGFFTKDTKEPIVVIALVFAVSLPIVSKLMTRFLPFLMKNGNDSFLVLGFKALLVGIMFFAMKKLLI